MVLSEALGIILSDLISSVLNLTVHNVGQVYFSRLLRRAYLHQLSIFGDCMSSYVGIFYPVFYPTGILFLHLGRDVETLR